MQWISVVYLPISLSDAQRVAAPSSQWSQHSAAQGRPRTLTHLRLETGSATALHSTEEPGRGGPHQAAACHGPHFCFLRLRRWRNTCFSMQAFRPRVLQQCIFIKKKVLLADSRTPANFKWLFKCLIKTFQLLDCMYTYNISFRCV